MKDPSATPAARRARFSLPPLPYPEDALAPVLSAETIGLHYGRHHRSYVDRTNRLVAEHGVEADTLEEVVKRTAGVPKLRALFNQAAQAWNHEFYWRSLSPNAGSPSELLLRRIEKDFGSYARLLKALAEAANGVFGSGWAWLAKQEGALRVLTTSNGETPMAQGHTCLLALDVWEHAYYVDYRDQRDRYVAAVLERRLNWAFAEENFSRG